MTPTVYIVGVNPRDLESSFIRAHIERLPARTVPIHGYLPTIGETRVLSDRVGPAALRKIGRIVRRLPWEEEITAGYLKAFADRPAAVLAEYGPTGVRVLDACRRAGLPLIVHFHGYDASVDAVLQEHAAGYRRLFDEADAIVAVSRAMCGKLLELGAQANRLHYCPYGVDGDRFTPGDPGAQPKVALAVGRFVEKKAPHLTILAFAEVHRSHPDARLRFAGDGPLLGPCADLVGALGLAGAVTFLGALPHDRISEEMARARCFVQHSVHALDGDAEGTPNSVIEAGASGLPVVSTRHAGIPDVVVEGVTGLLVDERDVDGMAAAMLALMDDPQQARRLGAAARTHVASEFGVERSVERLWAVVRHAIEHPRYGVAARAS